VSIYNPHNTHRFPLPTRLKADFCLAKYDDKERLSPDTGRYDPALHKAALLFTRYCLYSGDIREYEKMKREYFMPLKDRYPGYNWHADEEKIFLSAMNRLVDKGETALASGIALLDDEWRFRYLGLLLKKSRFDLFAECLKAPGSAFTVSDANVAKALAYAELMLRGDREGRLKLVRSGLYRREDLNRAMYAFRVRNTIETIFWARDTVKRLESDMGKEQDSQAP